MHRNDAWMFQPGHPARLGHETFSGIHTAKFRELHSHYPLKFQVERLPDTGEATLAKQHIQPITAAKDPRI